MFPFSKPILDFLFPPFCQGCGTDGAWLCRACIRSVPFLEPEEGNIHLAPYANPTVRILLTRLKYHSADCLRDSIGELLDRYPGRPIGKPDLIVPVPPSAKRLRERGIDQAALIAGLLKERWMPDVEIKQALKRTRHTAPNALMPDESGRRANVKGAFQADDAVSGKILLVDDVYTTGATLEASREALMRAGAESVHFFTVAKG
jgi:ComF family protein